ncbi:MAG: zinc-dependent peptidase [Flavobacterium sp.]|nr:zinc-dependent peptidase [Flavobacterium sp.]MDG2432262.1 zinc-dependent peptidase [Flavobacterium sp.]
MGLIVEPLYVLIFNKPFYIHWYPIPKRLSSSQMKVLSQEFTFYSKLPEKYQVYFEHRVASFLRHYKIIGMDGFELSDRSRVLIAATYVMLTFGMRRYLITIFKNIIVYPEAYLSRITGEMHKGEFNPGLKIIVFSWADFEEGFQFTNDNLNLGLHEFSHALYFHGLKGRDHSSAIFSDEYSKLQEYSVKPEVVQKLTESDYFRIYAYTNHAEFFAVVLEHFFETPHSFKREFPDLYTIVKKMINHKDH